MGKWPARSRGTDLASKPDITKWRRSNRFTGFAVSLCRYRSTRPQARGRRNAVRRNRETDHHAYRDVDDRSGRGAGRGLRVPVPGTRGATARRRGRRHRRNGTGGEGALASTPLAPPASLASAPLLAPSALRLPPALLAAALLPPGLRLLPSSLWMASALLAPASSLASPSLAPPPSSLAPVLLSDRPEAYPFAARTPLLAAKTFTVAMTARGEARRPPASSLRRLPAG